MKSDSLYMILPTVTKDGHSDGNPKLWNMRNNRRCRWHDLPENWSVKKRWLLDTRYWDAFNGQFEVIALSVNTVAPRPVSREKNCVPNAEAIAAHSACHVWHTRLKRRERPSALTIRIRSRLP